MDDKAYPIPEKYRASVDMSDEAAFELLEKNNVEQKKLSEKINSPFARNSPLDIQRSKALITIEALSRAGQFQALLPEQFEQLAEAHALIGRYDLAQEHSKLYKEHYAKYWGAVFAEPCEHPKHVVEYVFSIKEGKEMPLLACRHGHWAVAEMSQALMQGRAKRDVVRREFRSFTKGLLGGKVTIDQAIEWHRTNVKRV